MRTLSTLLGTAALLLAACTTHSEQPAAGSALGASVPHEKVSLRVSLFPWIPEKEAFATWIEREFEKDNPDIDLVVRPMANANADGQDLSYDYETTIKALKDPPNGDSQDLVEIDTVILGTLVKAKAIVPATINPSDYFEFANQAVTIGDTVYGVPHWSCGYFIITTDGSVAQAGTAAELKVALAGLGTPAPDLGGDVIGSWGSVASYLDAYVDSYPTGDLGAALRAATLDIGVASSLKSIGEACTSSGTGYCDRDDDDLVKLFGTGGLDALIGYSERLNILFSDPNNRKRPNTIKITPAPLGAGKRAFFFTDALVRSVNCISARCRDAADKFSRFYSSASVMTASMMSADNGPGAVPRYLLPASRGAMQDAAVLSDPIYRQLAPLLDTARPYPNQGIPEARASGVIGGAVKSLLTTPQRE